MVMGYYSNLEAKNHGLDFPYSSSELIKIGVIFFPSFKFKQNRRYQVSEFWIQVELSRKDQNYFINYK